MALRRATWRWVQSGSSMRTDDDKIGSLFDRTLPDLLAGNAFAQVPIHVQPFLFHTSRPVFQESRRFLPPHFQHGISDRPVELQRSQHLEHVEQVHMSVPRAGNTHTVFNGAPRAF